MPGRPRDVFRYAAALPLPLHVVGSLLEGFAYVGHLRIVILARKLFQLPGESFRFLLNLFRVHLIEGSAGAAALLQRRCQACRLELDRTALSELRAAPSDEIVYCEECGVILVRTPESGL